MKKRFILLSVHVVLAIFVIIFAITLHLIDNAMDSSWEGKVNWAGVIVDGVFVYDLVLYLLIGFQLAVIILILYLYYEQRGNQ
ncbi:MAG: hypothetical protein GF370_03395 [Candidatus Nealsonbacteria bacterium]|nr:hypothetical protein [Candidatus Nealsonbacteria bacterium]